MNRIPVLISILIMQLMAPALSDQSLVFYGNAADSKSGELLYQEVHTLFLNDQGVPVRETVEYQRDGERLGIKELEYNSLKQPDYTVQFKARPVAEAVKVGNDSIEVTRESIARLPKPDQPFAIDGGFHYFIQQNFQPLLAGEDVDFEFLSAGRADFIPLTISPQNQSGDQITLELSLQNFFLSKLVKPIVLVYDIKERRLLSYSGLTNVPDSSGDLYSATITYQYPASMASVNLP